MEAFGGLYFQEKKKKNLIHLGPHNASSFAALISPDPYAKETR
jgi:hypothetical protein